VAGATRRAPWAWEVRAGCEFGVRGRGGRSVGRSCIPAGGGRVHFTAGAPPPWALCTARQGRRRVRPSGAAAADARGGCPRPPLSIAASPCPPAARRPRAPPASAHACWPSAPLAAPRAPRGPRPCRGPSDVGAVDGEGRTRARIRRCTVLDAALRLGAPLRLRHGERGHRLCAKAAVGFGELDAAAESRRRAPRGAAGERARGDFAGAVAERREDPALVLAPSIVLGAGKDSGIAVRVV
jgi:hypothetical protein